MRALLQPVLARELGVVLLKPGRDLMELFTTGRVLIERQPESMAGYRGADCGYTGTKYFDKFGNAVRCLNGNGASGDAFHLPAFGFAGGKVNDKRVPRFRSSNTVKRDFRSGSCGYATAVLATGQRGVIEADHLAYTRDSPFHPCFKLDAIVIAVGFNSVKSVPLRF